MSEIQPQHDWHALTHDETLIRLSGSTSGIDALDAAERLRRYGPNHLPHKKARGPLLRFAAQFKNLLILILLAAAAVTALIGHWIDSGVILAVVVLNTLIGFVQEGKAERALDAIRHMLSPHAQVVRGGQRTTIDAADLVPGDIVFIQSGDRVPADMRLIQAKGLRVQESALTGESVPVEKRITPAHGDAALGDRHSMAYSGTLVASGQATGVVVATGRATEIGRISTMLADVESMTTPLLQQMSRFARTLSLIILVIAAMTFAYGFAVRGDAASDLFMIVVGLFVAAIPEGLPAILTVTLAIGVQRMAGRHAIIRKLPAVETLGSVSVICSDKTGTLTLNEMMVQTVVTDGGERCLVSGSGYAPQGDFDRTLRDAAMSEMARIAVLCNDSSLRRDDQNTWQVDGDPMEGALISLAMKTGLDPAAEKARWPRLDVIPFESDHAFMATLHSHIEGHRVIYIKGAPEKILKRCRAQMGANGEAALDEAFWKAEIESIAADGQRVLAAAYKICTPAQDKIEHDDVAGDLVFAGLYGLIDPPREEAKAAIMECRSAGIRVKMITGDHAATARAIAAQLGLDNTIDVLTGADLDGLSDDVLAQRVRNVDVFARTSPEHKLRLVMALQSLGLSVAMTGDGVNDAPALKRADIGIAMGIKGTEAAKEASEMVLTDDNFASIAAAVREGRTVYDNLKKAILFLLPVNGGESMALIAAVATGMMLPITPLQILWINMVSSVALALPLAFERAEKNIMQRPPRPKGQPILSRFVLWRVFLVSSLFVAGTFGMFLYAKACGLSVAEARTIAVNTLVMMELFYLFSVRYIHGASLTWAGIMGTKPVLASIALVAGLQLILTFTPVMNTLFGTAPINIAWGFGIVAVGIVSLLIVEIEKALRRRILHARD